jgi:hypothetical protein
MPVDGRTPNLDRLLARRPPAADESDRWTEPLSVARDRHAQGAAEREAHYQHLVSLYNQRRAQDNNEREYRDSMGQLVREASERDDPRLMEYLVHLMDAQWQVVRNGEWWEEKRRFEAWRWWQGFTVGWCP